MQFFGMVLGFEIVREGHTLAFGLSLAQGLEFFAALGDELVLVLRCGGRDVLFGHVEGPGGAGLCWGHWRADSHRTVLHKTPYFKALGRASPVLFRPRLSMLFLRTCCRIHFA